MYICHVKNDDKPAHLIIIKNVINDSGLTKVAGDFSGNITGVTAVGGNTWTGTVTPGVDKTLSSVGTYNVTENAAAGYTTSYSADCSGTIALGQTKTCTVTNNDNPASPAGTTVQKVFLHDAIQHPGHTGSRPEQGCRDGNLPAVYGQRVLGSRTGQRRPLRRGGDAVVRRANRRPGDGRGGYVDRRDRQSARRADDVLLDRAVLRRFVQHRLHDEVRSRATTTLDVK